MAKLDFLSDENDSDLLIENGDFVIGDNAPFQAMLLLKASPGEFRQFPSKGFSLDSYVHSKNNFGLQNEIIKYLEENGFTVDRQTFQLKVENGRIKIDADIK